MSQSSDLDPLKEIPGYKAILKSVLKSQIQLLIEQLADHTGEESIILTASINDGTLSHLGSNTGKGFLEGRDEMKSQFLGYCLKTHHRKKQAAEPKTPSYQRSNQRHMPYRPPPKHDRLHPISLQRTRPAEDTGVGLTDSRIPDLVSDNSGNDYVKQEGSDLNQSTAATFPDSLQLSHTQTLGDLENSGQGNGVSQGQIQGQTSESGEQDSEDANNDSSANIKIEPITENEMELEITGVEPGNVSLGQDDWGQGQPGYTTAGAEGDGSLSQGADASNYNFSTSGQEMYGYEVEYVWSEHISTGREVNSQLGIKKSTRKRPKNCACSICGKLFTWPVEVRRHERIHTGERPYICNICGKGFTRKFTMENHMLVHEIQQNFQKT